MKRVINFDRSCNRICREFICAIRLKKNMSELKVFLPSRLCYFFVPSHSTKCRKLSRRIMSEESVRQWKESKYFKFTDLGLKLTLKSIVSFIHFWYHDCFKVSGWSGKRRKNSLSDKLVKFKEQSDSEDISSNKATKIKSCWIS